MKILDVCCGPELMYHGMQADLPGFVTMDIRDGRYEWVGKAAGYIDVKPKLLADMRALPFKDNSFDGLIADPPHTDCGLTGFSGMKWGSWNQQQTNQIMTMANNEFARVLKPTGMLILKIIPAISDRHFKLLSKFQFFLPIQTVRATGFVRTDEQRNGAAWYIGVLRQVPALDTRKAVP